MPQEINIEVKLIKHYIPAPRNLMACYRLFRNVGHSILNCIRGAYLLTSYDIEIDGLKTSSLADAWLESV